MTIAKDGRGKRREPDVTAYQLDRVREARATRARSGPGQHALRSIDAHERHARLAQRQRDPAGAASQFENRTAGLQREIPPEGHIAPSQRARVLPVIERRVVVPPFVTLHYAFCPTVANNIVF